MSCQCAAAAADDDDADDDGRYWYGMVWGTTGFTLM